MHSIMLLMEMILGVSTASKYPDLHYTVVCIQPERLQQLTSQCVHDVQLPCQAVGQEYLQCCFV